MDKKYKGMAEFIGSIAGMQDMARKPFMEEKGLKHSSIESYLLNFGQYFETSDRQKKGGEMKECFMNSFRQSTNTPEKWTYCEGVAFPHNGIMPVHHAWLADPKGNVWDPTWNDGGMYFGVPFENDFVLKIAIETEVYGLFENGFRIADFVLEGNSEPVVNTEKHPETENFVKIASERKELVQMQFSQHPQNISLTI